MADSRTGAENIQDEPAVPEKEGNAKKQNKQNTATVMGTQGPTKGISNSQS